MTAADSRPLWPTVVACTVGISVACRLETWESTMAAQGHHQHDALKHRHKHYHVTHYLHQGENWGHLLSTHVHEHNHPALEHVHIPHRDLDKEHRREAHVHDHARPAESPA